MAYDEVNLTQQSWCELNAGNENYQYLTHQLNVAKKKTGEKLQWAERATQPIGLDARFAAWTISRDIQNTQITASQETTQHKGAGVRRPLQLQFFRTTIILSLSYKTLTLDVYFYAHAMSEILFFFFSFFFSK